MTVRALLLPTLLLRSESVDASIEVRHFAHAFRVQHHHEHAGEAEAVAAVGRTAVVEKVQIVLDGLKREPFLLGLLHEDIVAMLALRSRRHLKPLPEKVEALGEMGLAFGTHVVERSNHRWILGDEDKLMAGLFVEVPTQEPFVLRCDKIVFDNPEKTPQILDLRENSKGKIIFVYFSSPTEVVKKLKKECNPSFGGSDKTEKVSDFVGWNNPTKKQIEEIKRALNIE
jgi:hypothetical protein